MNKMKTLLVLFGLAFIPSTFLVAEVKYAASVPFVMDDFEKPGNWNIDFSSLKCEQWEAPDWVKNNNGASSTQTNTTNTQQTAAADNNTAPAPSTQQQNSTGSSTDWIKWFSVNDVAEDRKLTFLPLALQKKQENKSIMGVKGCWVRRGYNWLAVSPKEPMYTPSYPVSFSIYTWGNNYKYDLYLTVKNSAGEFYNLFVGSLDYVGWRELKINFPNYVFPTNRHNDNSKLEIVKLKVFGKPNEDSIGFYTYFDNMVVQQSFEQTGLYDGASLNDEKW